MLGGERRARRRRKKEMLRRLRELDRIDAAYGLGASAYSPPQRRPRGHGSGTAVTVGLTVAIVTVVVALGTSGVTRATRDLLGFGPEPLAQVPLLPEGDGSYAFMMTQPGKSKQPVAYDPCKRIEVVVNPEDAPSSWEDLVETGMRHIEEWSGLKLELVGETDEDPSEERPLEDPARYGEGYSPVLVSWTDDDEIPGLGGDVAGLGGSAAITMLGRSLYVTGQVTLDEDVFEQLQGRPDGKSQAQAIVDHEFGHLVGLDHVEDRGELMDADNNGQLSWGPGDKAGLSRLGRGRCF